MTDQKRHSATNEYHTKRDGILVRFPSGYSRFLTTFERVMLFFGKEPTP